MKNSPALSPQQIRRLRNDLGLSQREFSHLLDTTVPTVLRWETGRNAPRPRHQTALRTIQSHRAMLVADRMRVIHRVILGLQCGLKLDLLLRPDILKRLAQEDHATVSLLSDLLRAQTNWAAAQRRS